MQLGGLREAGELAYDTWPAGSNPTIHELARKLQMADEKRIQALVQRGLHRDECNDGPVLFIEDCEHAHHGGGCGGNQSSPHAPNSRHRRHLRARCHRRARD